MTSGPSSVQFRLIHCCFLLGSHFLSNVPPEMSANLARRGVAALDLATLAQLPTELAQTLAAAYDHNPRLNAYTSLVSPQGLA